MDLFLKSIFFIAVFTLSACSVEYKANLITAKQCNSNCANKFNYCKQHCDNSCVNCCDRAKQEAWLNYRKYVVQSQIKGNEIKRELNSYRDPLQCRKVTCDCLADLQSCKQSC